MTFTFLEQKSGCPKISRSCEAEKKINIVDIDEDEKIESDRPDIQERSSMDAC